MYFSIYKKFFVHISLPFLIILSFIAENGAVFRLFFLCAFLHECTHLAAAQLLGAKLNRLYLMPYGFELKLSGMSFYNEFLIIIAGPFASFLLFLLSSIFKQPVLTKINLSIFIFNLLPALPLDGGRLLRLVLWNCLGLYRGNKIMRCMGIIVPIFILIYCIHSFSGWLITIAVLIFITSMRNLEIYSPLVYKKSPCINKVKLFSLSREMKISDCVKFFSPYYHTVFVIKESHELVYEKDIISYCSRFGLGGLLYDLCDY